eukprot:CAMPEP_0181254510 /NCGR_PEP_ID=MMETSP1096-20121128/48647_1 /TAXON_ID=156174 ORGANISM="Chrysochromulina ericina, Strain CCMP281" /NCGR_SAMPLE_ID=MMETSP1096 /ASSEMBLY_ACC=CAM_ASM_000453 /LENGTH=34 /DNA_ID= /DNA_START= /DNA_END= /DNA_ORIENTATION=
MAGSWEQTLAPRHSAGGGVGGSTSAATVVASLAG